MEDFRKVVNDCLLRDIGFRSPKFTWCNGRDPNLSISECLDKFFGNPHWWNLFSQARVVLGGVSYLDYIPNWLKTEVDHIERRKEKLFRFEAIRLDESDCDNIVENTWRHDTGKVQWKR